MQIDRLNLQLAYLALHQCILPVFDSHLPSLMHSTWTTSHTLSQHHPTEKYLQIKSLICELNFIGF